MNFKNKLNWSNKSAEFKTVVVLIALVTPFLIMAYFGYIPASETTVNTRRCAVNYHTLKMCKVI